MPRQPSSSGPRGRAAGTSSRATGRPAPRGEGGPPSDRRSSGGRAGSKGSQSFQGRSGDSRGGKERAAGGRNRRDAEDRGSRRDGDDRRPRRDAEDRGPRRDGDDRRPRRGSDDRRPRSSDSRPGERRGPRPEPRTEAERRRAAVRARGGGTARQEDGKIRTSAPPERFAEQWIDEGPTNRRDAATDIRRVAQRAVKRAAKTDDASLDPATRLDVERSVPAKRQVVLSDRLRNAQNSLERERFSEAKRIARSLVKEMGGVAAVHEVIGLASYRMGQWRDATAALELARSIRPRVEDLPVLADCYRAQRRWQDVDDVWSELKQFSPSQEILSEGRIVYAGSLADRGDLYGAIAVMMRSATAPRRVREHHLRQWYVLADLYDRAGNVQKAREFFKRVATIDPAFADVGTRLHQL